MDPVEFVACSARWPVPSRSCASGGEIAGMALMGMGGLVAIVGGLLFVVVVFGAMRAGADGQRRAP